MLRRTLLAATVALASASAVAADTASTTIPFPQFRNPPPGSAAARWHETKGRPLPAITDGVGLKSACMGYGYDGPDQRAPNQCEAFIGKAAAGCAPPAGEAARRTFIAWLDAHPEAEQSPAAAAAQAAFCNAPAVAQAAATAGAEETCRIRAGALWPNTLNAFENAMRDRTYRRCMTQR